jgi:hypothetical protein
MLPSADTNPDPAIGTHRLSTAPYGIAFSVRALDFQTDPASTDLLIEVDNDFGPPWYIFGVRSLNNLTLPDGSKLVLRQVHDTYPLFARGLRCRWSITRP